MSNPDAGVAVESAGVSCPRCGALLPAHSDYAAWCPHCEWNLEPMVPRQRRRTMGALYDAIGRRASRALFAQMRDGGIPTVRMTGSKVLALTIAALVHLLTLAFFGVGVVLIVAGWPRFLLVLLGVIALGIGWLIRPRPAALPDEIVPRDEAPTLYAFVEQVAATLGVAPPHGIVVNEHFNAAIGYVGWRRRHILYVGLPLFAVLTDDERAALVGHELAHGINGDLAHSFVVGSAIASLDQLYALMLPDENWDGDTGIGSTLLLPINMLLIGLARVPWLVMYALAHLLWRSGQRAEYLADYLAATVSGTPAMRSMLDMLHLGQTYQVAVQASALGSRTRSFFPEFRERIARLPEHERERIRRVERMELSRLDLTHPPTVYRIQFLEAHPVAARMTTGTVDLAQLERELAAHEPRIERVLVDRYRRALYY